MEDCEREANVYQIDKRGLDYLENDSGKLFEKNLDYMKEHSSWRTLTALEKVIAVGTPPALRIVNGKEFYAGDILLHSRRAPELEATEQTDKWIAGENPDMTGMITVLGAGGLFHVREIAGRLVREGLLFVAELFPENFAELMRNIDFGGLFGNGNIFFSVSSDPAAVAYDFRVQLSRRNSIKTFFFTHPGTSRVWPVAYSKLNEGLVEEYSLEAMNRKTRAFYGPDWHRNTTLNLAYSFSSPQVGALKDIFKGMTAIVAAAGPSLNDAIPYIKQLESKAVIVAAGTALKPLLDAGIVADFTVAVDSSPNIFKQYSNCDGLDMYFVADTIVMPELFDKFRRRSFIFSSGSVPDMDELLAGSGIAVSKLAVGGTVSLSAIELARCLGCSDIILCGLDLAMAADGTSHAHGTVYDGKKADENELVECEGNSGSPVLTTKQFKHYIEIMRSYFGDPVNMAGINFVNASPAGARLGPLRVCGASEIATEASFNEPSGDKKELVAVNYAGASAKMADQAVGAGFFEKAERELPELREMSQKASLLAREAVTRPESLAELEKVEAVIKEKKTALRLVNPALRRALEALFGSGVGTISEALGKSAEMYSEMSDASGFTYDFLVQSARKYAELIKN